MDGAARTAPIALGFAAALIALLTGCGFQTPPPYTETEPGLPLPGLNQAELEAFAAGQAFFNQPFTEEEGLGPLFNQDRCGSCHDLPTSGGHGAEPVTKVSRFDPVEGCSTLPEHGGDLLQTVVIESARAMGFGAERIPPEATAVTEIRAPAVYGLGLVEGIPEADILRSADPDDLDGDGISGRPNLDPAGRAGRFGRRSQHTTLDGFIEEAIRLEMGITTPANPVEEAHNGVPLPEGIDLAPDPEVGAAELESLVEYLRFLAPPQPILPDDSQALADIEEGERIFAFMGCDACHTPSFTTSASESPALDRKRFRLYSDLLLHDMGPELADICSPGTLPSEWKTARLVGLGHRSEFLHNGRAQRISDAILLHGGEAAASRDVFRRLTDQARSQVLAFLRSL